MTELPLAPGAYYNYPLTGAEKRRYIDGEDNVIVYDNPSAHRDDPRGHKCPLCSGVNVEITSRLDLSKGADTERAYGKCLDCNAESGPIMHDRPNLYSQTVRAMKKRERKGTGNE